MERIVEALAQADLFERVKAPDLKQIAALFERVEFKRGDYVTQQGEPGNHFFLLESGLATVYHMDPDGVERSVRRLAAGAHFGVRSLFLEDVRDATVRASQDSTFLRLDRVTFAAYLRENPAVSHALVLPADLRQRLDAPRFKWMTPDEFAVFFATKSIWALVSSEALAVLLALVVAAAAFFFRQWLVAAFGGLVVVLVALLRWWDWRNDHYVITNKRVVHHESQLISLRVSVDQAPLHQIQNVTLLRPNPMARLLDYGTLAIETAGRQEGSIVFHNLDNPVRCKQALFDLLEKSRALARVSEQIAIREAIAQQIHPDQDEPAGQPEQEPEESAAAPAREQFSFGEAVWDMGPAAASAPAAVKKPASPAPQSALGRMWERIDAFLPHARWQEGDLVTWYKHPLILLRQTWKPGLALLISLGGGIGWAVIGGRFLDTIALVLYAVWCLSLFWLLWQYEDWRNDIFQMTASHVIDIDRLPLGFRERRRQAALGQVQNINADVPNMWARLFNYGNVIIETAGATGDLTFEWVTNPRSVQAEIFQRIEELRDRQRTEEAEQRRKEMARWFSVYNQMKEERDI